MNLEEISKYVTWYLSRVQCPHKYKEDASQECLLRIYEKQHMLDTERGSLSTLLFYICRTAYLNFMRKEQCYHSYVKLVKKLPEKSIASNPPEILDAKDCIGTQLSWLDNN